MANDWNIKPGDIGGPDSGKELEGSMIRAVADEAGLVYEFLAVVARTTAVDPKSDQLHFPAFAYNGLVWNVSIDPPFEPGEMQIGGQWRNNKRPPGLADVPDEEDGTYTAQSGSGLPEEERGKKEGGKEDAASASA